MAAPTPTPNRKPPRPSRRVHPACEPAHSIRQTSTLDVPDLVRRLKMRDNTAWHALAAAVHPASHRLASTLACSTSTSAYYADELVHEVQTRLWEHLVQCQQPPNDQAELTELAAKLLWQIFDTVRAQARRERHTIAALRDAASQHAQSTPATGDVPVGHPPVPPPPPTRDTFNSTRASAAPRSGAAPESHLISDLAWASIEPVLKAFWPCKRTGRRPVCWRRCLEGIAFCLITGTAWHHLPPQFGPPSTVHTWYRRWADSGVLDAIWPQLTQFYPGLEPYQGTWHQARRSGARARARGATPPTPLARRRNRRGRPPSHSHSAPREAGLLLAEDCVIASINLDPGAYAWLGCQLIVSCHAGPDTLIHKQP